MARQKMITLKLTPVQYWAICKVVASSKQTFVNWNEDEQEWESNDDFICSLTDEEKQELMKF